MNTAQIRQAFLNYFNENGHQIVPSSSLVPGNDPTLLFTNAGMVQFKDVFLGTDNRDYTRATSSQRCVRAGGKHNDLENVGYTARHHTFFEMLGNFSFGDYFKSDAIKLAWTFLTEVLGLPKEKLWVTVYHEDKEAEDIWFNEMNIDQTRFSRLGEKDNFWAMGDTGPCGPCTEIFYDHGEDVAGGPPGTPEEDGDRYIEIWNLVFMQYNRSKDGTLNPLPKPSVDTGMGLERIAAVMQGVHSNYEIDLFVKIIESTAKLLSADLKENSLKVIADHIRSCSFLIADGVLPSNEGRGYVLRRIIRRAIRHGHKLGTKTPFFHKLVSVLVETMGEAYPELTKSKEHIEKILLLEEEQFGRTIDAGMEILLGIIDELKGDVIAGEDVFKLYDTYGFPQDLTADIAREKGLSIDQAGFEKAMEAQRERARAGSHFSMDASELPTIESNTEFLGYETTSAENKVVALFSGSESKEQLTEGEDGIIFLSQTPFYAESGGQVGDTGVLKVSGGEFEVIDTQKSQGAFAHIGRVKSGEIKIDQVVNAEVVENKRLAIARNHTATHLLHATLREILGDHVTQKGSLVDEEKLRFDFSHMSSLSTDEIIKIEQRVNQKVLENIPVVTEVKTPEEAIEAGAMALFGEKYGKTVRVISMGEFSIELCGGTHVNRTGDIGLFKINVEGGIAAGVRRIEAVTGYKALTMVQGQSNVLGSLAAQFKSDKEQVADKVKQLFEKNKSLEKELAQLKAKLASQNSSSIIDSAVEINGVKVLAQKIENVDAKALRTAMDDIKSKLNSAVVLLAAENDGKVQLIAGVSKDLTKQFKAGDLIKEVAGLMGGRGGGRPDMAQGGADDASKLPEALEAVKAWVESKQ